MTDNNNSNREINKPKDIVIKGELYDAIVNNKNKIKEYLNNKGIPMTFYSGNKKDIEEEESNNLKTAIAEIDEQEKSDDKTQPIYL